MPAAMGKQGCDSGAIRAFGAFCETIWEDRAHTARVYLCEGSCATDFLSFSCSSSSGRLDGIWSTADVGALKLFPASALQKSEFARRVEVPGRVVLAVSVCVWS